MASRKNPILRRATGALGALTLVATAVAAAWLKRRNDSPGTPSSGSQPSGPASPALLEKPPAASEATPRQRSGGGEWHCQCGQTYRVTGEGRHRMFWLPDAAPEDPVLDDRCPNCGRELSLQH